MPRAFLISKKRRLLAHLTADKEERPMHAPVIDTVCAVKREPDRIRATEIPSDVANLQITDEEARGSQLPTPPLSPKRDEEEQEDYVPLLMRSVRGHALESGASEYLYPYPYTRTTKPQGADTGLVVRAPVATRPQVSPPTCLPHMMHTPPPAVTPMATAPMTTPHDEKPSGMYWNAQPFFHAYYPYGLGFPTAFYPPHHHALHRLSPPMPPPVMSLSPPHLSPKTPSHHRLTPLRPEPIKYSDHQKENERAPTPNSGAERQRHVIEKPVSRRQEVPRYQCGDCSKSYSTFSGLSKHKQFHCVSQAKKAFSCKYCEKVYVSLGALKMHIRTHTLPCKCKLCGKAFSRPWLLQGHIRTHTGEKPFECSLCHRSFADRSNLRAHLQTHSDVKKYCCKLCMKTFSRMSLLLKHEEGGCRVCPVRVEPTSVH